MSNLTEEYIESEKVRPILVQPQVKRRKPSKNKKPIPYDDIRQEIDDYKRNRDISNTKSLLNITSNEVPSVDENVFINDKTSSLISS